MARSHWKKDPKFLAYNQELYTEQFKSFKEVFEFCTVSTWSWDSAPATEWKVKAEKKWLKLVNRWKIHTEKDELPGFAAITLLFAVLPYEKLGAQLGQYLTLFEADQVNAAYFFEIGQYYIGGRNLPIKDLLDLAGGPLHPGAYQEWLNEKYNEASWRLTYLVYERREGLSPIIESPPAELNI